MTQARATGIGFIAVLLWALLALFTVGSAPVPPLQLNMLSFGIGTLLGLGWLWRTGEWAALRRVPMMAYVAGTVGLFGYHALYFTALRLAPPAQAGLVAYLWPLLIVLTSGMLPGERLRPLHLVGGLMGFTGAAVIILRGDGTPFSTGAMAGYGVAFLCALTWTAYSVGSRMMGNVPTAAVVVFCGATTVLSGILHIAVETPVWPTAPLTWASIIGLGLGPVGLAFYTWDVGVKRGDLQLLGVASYAAPLLSTIVLVVTGFAAPTWSLALATVLITGGATLAAKASAAKDVQI
ncbi:DMT family transporter [Rhodovulum sp. FJ3]|uniref:aromatic amino acid exporter YddG n=1 Tax=Rhodovulum sp. FJ3 TaxID=3079053 RepID=UPI00293DD551|nr:EamA family transporter [Rhodovulum sp. FJ3]MDV4169500.1 EamA family transporter [Rhodovulum sp. FJ3]